MFIGIQFPFIDSRRFIPSNTNKLIKPIWGLALEGEEFVRSFGIVAKTGCGHHRKKIGSKVPNKKFKHYTARAIKSFNRSYLGVDGTFSKANRAISFPSLKDKKKIGNKENPFFTFCLYRRLFYDGEISSQVEIGFRDALIDAPNRENSNSEIDLEAILDDVLRMPVKIPRNNICGATIEFQNSGRKLAAHYLASTTKIVDKELLETRKWWVQDGVPMVYVEFESNVNLKPFYYYSHSKRVILENNLELSYFIYRKGPKPINIWVLKATEDVDKDYLRRLRQKIFRLNAKVESLKNILRHIISEKIKLKRNHPATEELQGFLKESIKYLGEKKKFGVHKLEILKTLMDVMFAGDEYANLMTYLNKVEKKVKENLNRLLATAVSPKKEKSFYLLQS